MIVNIPTFPEVVDRCIQKIADDLWEKYPQLEQCEKFIPEMVSLLEINFRPELITFPEGLVKIRLFRAIFKKAFPNL